MLADCNFSPLQDRLAAMGESQVMTNSRRLLIAFCIAAALGTVAPRMAAQSKGSEPMTLQVGQEAPDFKLQYFDGTDLKDVTLSQYRGKKNVILAFYIFAFTGG
jgi:hypothetical protein